MVVDGGDGQATTDGRPGVVGVPVRDDQGAPLAIASEAATEVLERVGQPGATAFDVIEARSTAARSPGCSPSALMWTIRPSSSLSVIGHGTWIWRHDAAVG